MINMSWIININILLSEKCVCFTNPFSTTNVIFYANRLWIFHEIDYFMVINNKYKL